LVYKYIPLIIISDDEERCAEEELVEIVSCKGKIVYN
jgi:hypothetical protein